MNEGLDMPNTELLAWIAEGVHLFYEAIEESLSSGPEDDTYTVLYLLTRGVNINAYHKDHETPLHLAVMSDNLKLVALLVKNHASLTHVNMHGETPLHNACRGGSSRIVTCLINAGCDKDAKTYDGNTPLHNAVRFNRIENIRILILSGANPMIKNRRGEHPMNLRCSNETKMTFKNTLEEKNEMDHDRNVEGVNRSSLYD